MISQVFVRISLVFVSKRSPNRGKSGPTDEVSRICAKKRRQERAKSAQERPRSSQGRPKGAPRGSSWRPGGSQRSSRRLPEAPRRGLGDHLGVSKPKMLSFESPLWRESFEKRVRCDFPLIFEARAQTQKCKKHIKTCGFIRFFVGGVFFEKVSRVQGKRMKK